MLMRQTLAIAGVCVALIASACGSGQPSPGQPTAISSPTLLPSASLTPSPLGATELRGCIPACGRPGLVRPGSLPEGEYTTRRFFGSRMTLTFHGKWSSHEDSTGEFEATPDGTANEVFFWEDVYPVESGQHVDGVAMTAKGLLDWIKQSKSLDVSTAKGGFIGKLPATIVDVTVSKDAVNEDPGCPTKVCVLFLGFPQWDGPWGIAASQVQRFYLADVIYGGQTHLFVAVIYPDKGADIASFAPVGEELIDTVRVPVTPG
jgi:hypothetical protein